jgi:hypothetical protein
VCLGYPTTGGQYAIAGLVGFEDGATSYGGAVDFDLTGPLAFDFGYTLTTIDGIDDNANTFAGRGSFELALTGASVCPNVGLTYSSFGTDILGVDVDVSAIVVPIGVGLGKSFAASPTLQATLFANPQFFYIREKFEGAGQEDTDTSSEFGADIGATLGTSRFFVGGGVFFTTIEDSDPTFNVRVGIVLPGR